MTSHSSNKKRGPRRSPIERGDLKWLANLLDLLRAKGVSAINWCGVAIELSAPVRAGKGLHVEEAPERDPEMDLEDMFAASAYVPVDLKAIREELKQ